MFKTLSDCFTLSNGVKIPCVGYGTYRTPDGEVCASGVEKAIECGYRHIDTAEFYDNEAGVGEGIARSGI
ncbi:MAG: aldo/keto reductase, partial [Clostridia bacterium]